MRNERSRRLAARLWWLLRVRGSLFPSLHRRRCPNCGNPVETHAVFDPPRCPVVRLRFPSDATEAAETIVAYSAAVAGEDADLVVYAEIWANADHERID